MRKSASQSVLLLTASLLVSSCSRSNPTPASTPTPAPTRWVLLGAPHMLSPKCTENDPPCTGRAYLRAPLSDWERLGEHASFQECAAAIHKPDADPNPEEHKQGKLTPAERILGFNASRQLIRALPHLHPTTGMLNQQKSESGSLPIWFYVTQTVSLRSR